VYENVDDVIDSDGRPPHSIEVVATGGDPQQIAQQIFNLKAAGIDTFGDVIANVVDTSGYSHEIRFNRPTPIFAWVNIDVWLYDEEQFPTNGDVQISDIIIATGNTFGPGKDIIVQRFLGPIYSSVSGIGRLDITVGTSSDDSIPPTAYVPDNLPVAVREFAVFNSDRISVTIHSS
jgi:hypothetical protein